jgi:glycosyltransferase involved in cell wall biosynthesis
MSASSRDLPLSVPAAAAVRRPSICFVGIPNLSVLAPDYDRRGAAGEPVQHTLLAMALARRGYKISMVVADHGQPDGATWDDITTYKAFRPTAGLPVLRYLHPRWTGLWSALKRADADVYYASCAGGQAGQIAMFCARQRRRFVFRAASDADCKPNELIINHWYWRDKLLYEYALRHADAVLVQSERQQQLMRENFAVRSEIAALMISSARSDLPFRARDIGALWVSNLRQVKRPDVLLDVAARLADVTFHMVGGPMAEALPLFAAMKTRAASLGVAFHGAVAFRDAAALYGRARLFVNTSDVEGFPNTYLQAWASGTPVVALFDPDGVIAREGLGIAVRTPDEMVEAIRYLSYDEPAWSAMRARCLAFIESRYSEALVLQPYLRAFGADEIAAVSG